MNFKNIFLGLKEAYLRFKNSDKIRNGSKVAICWLVFSAILIVWLLIGIPMISIFYPHITSFFPHLDKVIIALIGGGSVIFSTVEIRKTIENTKGKSE